MTREEFMEKAWVIKWVKGGDTSWIGDTIFATFNLYDDWVYISHSIRVQGHYLNDFTSIYYEDITKIEVGDQNIQIFAGKSKVQVRHSL